MFLPSLTHDTDALQVASPQDYLQARLGLLEKEKEVTKLRDKITMERATLPLVELKKDYTFVDAETGKTVTMNDMFEGRPQLIVYHAMFDPSWVSATQSPYSCDLRSAFGKS